MTDPIRRLHNPEAVLKAGGTVWSCCRWCNADIPASEKTSAFCNMDCKKALMAREMGFAPRGGIRA